MVSRTSPSKRALLALGVALLASLSLFASLAQGAKLPPENTALPVISPTTPGVGKVATTTNGTWTNEPTSYTYAWLRCSTAGTECASIAGATSSFYTVTEADAGHTLASAVTAINAFGKATAQSKATGKIVLPTQYWYACGKYGGFGGKTTYTDPACSIEGAGKYSWSKLTGESGFTMKSGATPLVFESTNLLLTLSCSTQSGEGTISNPAGGAAGTASVWEFKLSGCSVVKPENQASKCQVSNSASGLVGKATELEGKPALKFEGASFTFEFSGASCIYHGPYTFSGAFSGVSNSANSSLEFSSAGSALLQGSKPVSITGMTKIETKAGEPLKLAS